MSRVVLNDAAIADLLHNPAEVVARATRSFADSVVEHARVNAPLGYDQGGIRDTGALREDMGIHGDTSDSSGPAFVVGTDPVNRRDDFHYGATVHDGRGPIFSARRMKFRTRNGNFHSVYTVGPADGQPFLYDAVAAVNGASETEFDLVKTPSV